MAKYIIQNKANLIEVNTRIGQLLESNNPFSVIRIGNMEGYFLDCFNRQTMPKEEFFYWLSLTSGVHPVNIQYLIDVWAPHNYSAMYNSDLLGFVDISGDIKSNLDFNNRYCKDKFTFYGVDDILALDPGYLVNEGLVNVDCPNPWTANLKGKKVLVVSAFKDTIEHQWNNIDNVWGDKRDKLAPYDLVGVIRAPFHPQMDSRQFPGCDTWDMTLQYMKDRIDEYEYDVLFVSAAAWAPSLADHAKRKGKVGITICGTLQLYYGIIGARWAGNNPSYTEWPKMFNKHWMYPFDNDLPQNKDLFNRFERAYWK
jgi:hypothetical protein